MLHKFFNLFLRLGGMGSKFILMILLSKFLATDVYGKFNLITTTITILIYVLGLDFYNYAIRDILTKDEDKTTKLVNTFSLYSFLYFIFFIVLYFTHNFFDFLNEYYLLFFFISITEHLSQELYRFQISFKKITFANILLFLRVFGYTSIIIIYYLLEKELNIYFILKTWALFNGVVVIISLIDLFKDKKFKLRINKSWLLKGFNTSIYFFTATFFLKIIEYSNRYIIALFLTDSDVGIYSFYSNIAIIITVYVNTIVVSYQLPILIEKSYSSNIKNMLQKTEKDLFKQSFLSFLISGLIMLIFLFWQNKIEYKSYISLYIFLGIGSFIVNVSLVYYFNLFIHNKEKQIMTTTLKSGLINIILSFILIYYMGLYGAAIAAVLSALSLFYFRRIESKKIEL